MEDQKMADAAPLHEDMTSGISSEAIDKGKEKVLGELTHEDNQVKEGKLEEEEEEEEEVVVKLQLVAKWNGTTFKLTMPATCTVGQLKLRMCELTNVLEKRQKLVGLVKGKLPSDDDCLGDLNLVAEKSFIMMGTPEKDIVRDPNEADVQDIINDFDFDYEGGQEEHHLKPENKLLLELTIQKTSITVINTPRPGKKLLVLDLDYTLFDCKSTAESVMEMARPGLHEFLTLMYQDYDMVVWSQTSWKWLEMKITSLGMLTHPSYRLSFVLDRTSMFKIQSRDSDGNPWAHEVKALGIIWSKFPQFYSPANSVHLDDLGRNFAMNPQSGLKIKAFKNAHTSRATDKELYHIGLYLNLISSKESDFRTLNHKKWKKYIEKGKL